MYDTYVCLRCGLEKPAEEFHVKRKSRPKSVQGVCKTCRSEGYFRKRYPLPCVRCERYRKLEDGLCTSCWKEDGLRKCKGPCGQVLPEALCFYANQARCKECMGIS